MIRCAAHSFSRMIMRKKLRQRTEFAKDLKNKANYQETETLFCNILAIFCAFASISEVLHFSFPPGIRFFGPYVMYSDCTLFNFAVLW